MNIFKLCAALLVLLLFAAESDADNHSTVIDICVVCHGADGSGVGFKDVPIIAGTPATHIEEAIYAYQDGTRECVNEPVMCASVDLLDEHEIAEAADYFAAMPRISSGEKYNKHLATAGERIHKQHCAKCHVLPTDADVENALGIPLHGQRADYLRYAFEAYRNGNRLTLIPQMAVAMSQINDDDFEALINYYASYKP